MNYKKLLIIAGCSLALTLTGCLSSDSANVYRRGEMRSAANIYIGTIESIREVRMEDSTGIGTVAGAAIGAIAAGRNIGGGSGRYVSGILGGIAGSLVGDKLERTLTGKRAYEITVKLQSGKLISIVQETDISFRVGDTVRVVDDGRTSRVTPY